MSIYDNNHRLLAFLPSRKSFRANTLAGRLLLALVPSLILLLAVTGYLTYRLSADFIAIALQRNVRVQNLAQVHAIEEYIERAKSNLLFLAQEAVSFHSLREFLLRETTANGREYPFIGFISLDDDRHLLLVQEKERLLQLDSEDVHQCSPDLLGIYGNIKELPKDTAWLSSTLKAVYPFPTSKNRHNRLVTHVMLLAAPVFSEEKQVGYLVLALQAQALRNILSLYNSNESPLWAYARSPEVRFSFLFNLDGWVLFQSENPQRPEVGLGTYLMRAECEGTMGLPGLESAFRPGAKCRQFWKMVAEVREGRQGLLQVPARLEDDVATKEHSVAFSPVRFSPTFHGPSQIIAGVAFEDRSRLTMMAGYKHVDVMFMITLAAGACATLLIFILSRFVTRPLKRLTKAVKEVKNSGRLDPITIRNPSYETALLQDAVNSMLLTMRKQLEEIHIRDMLIRSENLREPIEVDESYLSLATNLGPDSIAEIIGIGPRMDTLREEILKAAKVDVDVLIVGETGTGKQLTAEAIHGCSNRKCNTMISINCGELDENLLMDTLFGHVKGAFTEAKHDRKGAFLEAHGGTLFLDEIQVASPRVQQALLRAIALRKVKPLGSDGEQDVDVRVIAATNVDLRHLIEAKLFREDLYFRLKVITVNTPALRDHRENLLLLALHFLREGERLAKKSGLALSKGALERMKAYKWPGNIRELRNCVIRAVVMTENQIIQADDLLLDGEGMLGTQDELDDCGETSTYRAKKPQKTDEDCHEPPVTSKALDGQRVANSGRTPDRPERQRPLPEPETTVQASSDSLNSRQASAWPEILKMGKITRGEYENLHGGDVSARTANYDLQDMVEKGLLRKTGQGPATRYVVVRMK